MKWSQIYLTRAMGSSTTNTGNTGNSTTSTPRLGRSLVAGLLTHGVCLPPVLGNALWSM